MRIGELARLAGTSTRSLRYYEQQGLLAARRDGNGHRDYDESDLRLVREIRGLLTIGFALEETRPFVDCLRSGHASGDSCPASVAVYRRKLAEVEGYLDRLTEVRQQLRDQLARAEAALTGTDIDTEENDPCTVRHPSVPPKSIAGLPFPPAPARS